MRALLYALPLLIILAGFLIWGVVALIRTVAEALGRLFAGPQTGSTTTYGNLARARPPSRAVPLVGLVADVLGLAYVYESGWRPRLPSIRPLAERFERNRYTVTGAPYTLALKSDASIEAVMNDLDSLGALKSPLQSGEVTRAARTSVPPQGRLTLPSGTPLRLLGAASACVKAPAAASSFCAFEVRGGSYTGRTVWVFVPDVTAIR